MLTEARRLRRTCRRAGAELRHGGGGGGGTVGDGSQYRRDGEPGGKVGEHERDRGQPHPSSGSGNVAHKDMRAAAGAQAAPPVPDSPRQQEDPGAGLTLVNLMTAVKGMKT
eukprot:XP_001693630.1 predicted protein [Chlamydomonas reinhardtii]